MSTFRSFHNLLPTAVTEERGTGTCPRAPVNPRRWSGGLDDGSILDRYPWHRRLAADTVA